jgi:hypothetical protein
MALRSGKAGVASWMMPQFGVRRTWITEDDCEAKAKDSDLHINNGGA